MKFKSYYYSSLNLKKHFLESLTENFGGQLMNNMTEIEILRLKINFKETWLDLSSYSQILKLINNSRVSKKVSIPLLVRVRGVSLEEVVLGQAS